MAMLSVAAETRMLAGIEFVRIPAGSFTMGSPESEPNRKPDEAPLHEVTFDKPFWMSAREITQAQWTGMGENMKNPSETKGDDLPVTNVSWDDCAVFLNALNAAAPGFFRLPTEAEWEYACRAGSKAAYDFGGDAAALGDHAWFAGNSNGAPQPVGPKTPNAWGLYDMQGNVYEWCLDQYTDSYRGAPANGEAVSKVSAETVFVRRGGSFSQPPENCRCAFRGSGKPGNARNDVGVRVVMIEPEESVANKVTFAAVTYLWGDGHIDDKKLPCLHGKFSPGLNVTLLVGGQQRCIEGKTREFFPMFNAPSEYYLSLTRVECAPEEKDYPIAVMGATSVSVLSLAECAAPVREELDKRARPIAFKDWNSPETLAKTTVTWARQGKVAGRSFKFILYATPAFDPASTEYCRTLACELPHGGVFTYDILCGGEPVIFEVDGNAYVVFEVSGCSNGIWVREVFRLEEDKAERVYSNDDWGS